MHVHIVDKHVVLVIVDRQRADAVLPGLGQVLVADVGARVADRRADAGQQFGGAEGLFHIVVRAHVQRRHLVVLVRARGDDDHRKAGPGAHLPQYLQPVHVGKAQVQNDQIRTVRGDHGARLRAGGSHNGIKAVGLQYG